MLTLGPLAFAAPWLLVALAALPVLWWLLRVTPPTPRRVSFPAVRLLHDLPVSEETPSRTPWWLLLLRIAAAALVVLGLARPVWGPGAGVGGEGPLLLAFLPPDTLPRLRAGQPLFLQGRSSRERMASTILEVAPEVMSPAAARARFGLEAVPAQALAGPSALVVARFEPSAPGGKPADHLGSVYPVNVQVGARRLLWLLPLVDTIAPE